MSNATSVEGRLPLTADDLAYIHELIAAEESLGQQSRHLTEEAPAGILQRLAHVKAAPLPHNCATEGCADD